MPLNDLRGDAADFEIQMQRNFIVWVDSCSRFHFGADVEVLHPEMQWPPDGLVAPVKIRVVQDDRCSVRTFISRDGVRFPLASKSAVATATGVGSNRQLKIGPEQSTTQIEQN